MKKIFTKDNVIRFLSNHLADIINISIAIITLFIAQITLNVAENAYTHDGENYRANILIEKSGDMINVQNKDSDLFEIESIDIEKRHQYRININDESTTVELLAMNFYDSIVNENVDSLNNTKIDTTIFNNHSSKNDEILFDNMYKVALEKLQKKYNVGHVRTVVYINIEYFNKQTYESNELELMAYLEEDGSIKRFYPNNRGKNRYLCIPISTEYEYINDNWDMYINEINNQLGLFNGQLTIEDEGIND